MRRVKHGRKVTQVVTEHGMEKHGGMRTEGSHLNSCGELDLIENKCDKVSTAYSPTCHQPPTYVQDPHLQQHL